jgi:hypothetical protein
MTVAAKVGQVYSAKMPFMKASTSTFNLVNSQVFLDYAEAKTAEKSSNSRLITPYKRARVGIENKVAIILR